MFRVKRRIDRGTAGAADLDRTNEPSPPGPNDTMAEHRFDDASDESDRSLSRDVDRAKVGLTDITTMWTTITHAHTPGPQRQSAMEDLVARYLDAVTRYIQLKVRDKHLADEVVQEFWKKLLSGKLAGADKSKGRFRDYMRTVLHRLIIDHFRSRKLQSLPPGDILDSSQTDQDFDRVWRDAVLSRVWSRLETYQVETPKNRYSTVLQLRRDHPDASNDEIAEMLGKITQSRVTPEAFRKNLQRARAKWIELLVQELRETIHPASLEDVEAEINDLGLGHLYRRYHQSAEK